MKEAVTAQWVLLASLLPPRHKRLLMMFPTKLLRAPAIVDNPVENNRIKGVFLF